MLAYCYVINKPALGHCAVPAIYIQPAIDHSSDPLQYWEANINVFPNLSKLALEYLTVSALYVAV